MSSQHLENAPLILVQLHIHFSELPSTGVASPAEIASLHKALMKIGLAEKVETAGSRIQFETDDQNPDGYFKVKQDEIAQKRRFVFKGFSDKRLLEISSNYLSIKISDYSTFEDMSKFVASILDCIDACIEDISNVLLESLGLRFIDTIFPSKENHLADYISSTLLPYHPDFVEYEKAQGFSHSKIRIDADKEMIVVFEEISGNQEGGPIRLIPIDLMEPERRAALKLEPSISEYEFRMNYGILSVDHRQSFPDKPKWPRQIIESSIQDLYQPASSAFWGSITEFARKEWGIKNA